MTEQSDTSVKKPKKIRTTTLKELKAQGKRFACLTSYDALTAAIFDEAGLEVLLVGDSAADNSLGYTSTLPITLDEMIPFGRAVAAAAKRALVVVDLPFGSYEVSAEQALQSGIRVLKETGAAAVKLEGGRERVAQVRSLVSAGVPVMGHLGFTPQSLHALGGFKVQGKGEDADRLLNDALALQEAGCFAVVLELVPAQLAAKVSKALQIPTIGIGAGPDTDAQILVWTDFAGMTAGPARKFVKRYAELAAELKTAAAAYHDEVLTGEFPSKEHSFEA